MEYLILTAIIIGIIYYLVQYRKSRIVMEVPKYERSHPEVQNDTKTKIDENTTIYSCAIKQAKPTPDEKCFAYIDIETTSLNPSDGDLTVIGLYLENGKEHRVIQLIENEISSSKLVEIMKKVKVLYTYNGTRFDLPFIKAKLGIDLTKYCIHKDLMYECWRRNLYGGFKEVERKLGIKRKLTGVDGRIAVQLWRNYKFHGDRNSLTTLLEYNKEDVSNLRVLRQKLNI